MSEVRSVSGHSGKLSVNGEAFNFDFYQVPVPVNTYTHLYAFYQDFGAVGVVIIPFILGYLETRFYLRMKFTPNVFWLAGCSALIALNVFSIFVPLVTNISFWYFFAVMYLLQRYSSSAEFRPDTGGFTAFAARDPRPA